MCIRDRIPEPARTVEILVRTGFHTEAADAAFADLLHLAAQFFFTLYAMHPQKGIQGIGGLSMQDITNAFHARVLSFRFTHSEHSTAPVPDVYKRQVVALPIEATAIGNLKIQMNIH